MVDRSEFVEEFLFSGVHLFEFVVGVLELFDGEVGHAFGIEGASEEEEDFDADVGVAGGLLEVRDGLAVLSGIVVGLAEIEAEFGVGGVLVDALFAFDEPFFEAALADFGELRLEFGVIGVGGGGGFDLFDVFLGGAIFDLVGFGLEGDVGGVDLAAPRVELVGGGEVFELFVGIGELLDDGEVVGVGLVLSGEFGGAFFELFVGEGGAVGFFEGGGFVSFDHIAEAGAFIHAVFLHGGFGGAVFFAFDSGAIGGILFYDVAVDAGGVEVHVAGDVELGEFVGDFGIFGVPHAGGFEGESGGIEEGHGASDVVEGIVDADVEGVFFEFFFGGDEGTDGVFFRLADEGSTAACAAAEEAFFGAAGGGASVCDGGLAEEFAGVEESGLFFEDGLEEFDGVSVVIAFDAGFGVFPMFAESFGEFFFGNFADFFKVRHGLRELLWCS